MNEPIDQSRRPVTLRELSAGLIWPLLFRSTKLAMQPSRLGLAFMMVALMMATGALFDLATRSSPPPDGAPTGEAALVDAAPGVFSELVLGATSHVNELSSAIIRLDRTEFIVACRHVVGSLSPAHWADQWLSAPLLIVVLLSILAIGGGGICRMAAVDVAGDRLMTAPEALGFCLPRARHFALAVLAPLIAIGLAFAALSIGGWAFFSLSWISPVGGAAYGLMLLGGLISTLLVAGYFFGFPLLTPAIAIESTDWLDAVQRTYAYVLGRPGRIAAYMAIAGVFGLISFAVIAWIMSTSLNLTASLTAFDHRIGTEGADVAYRTFHLAQDHIVETDGEGDGAAALLIGVWQRLAVWLVGAFALSYFFCASTVVYLLARRVNDLQDIHEIWMPGMIPSTMSPEAPTSTNSD